MCVCVIQVMQAVDVHRVNTPEGHGLRSYSILVKLTWEKREREGGREEEQERGGAIRERGGTGDRWSDKGDRWSGRQVERSGREAERERGGAGERRSVSEAERERSGAEIGRASGRERV